MEINFDKYSKDKIYEMIRGGECTEQDVINYYRNEWWNDDNN